MLECHLKSLIEGCLKATFGITTLKRPPLQESSEPLAESSSATNPPKRAFISVRIENAG